MLVSGLLNGGPITTKEIATNFKMPTGVSVVNDRIYVADKDSFYVIPDNTGANPGTNRQRGGASGVVVASHPPPSAANSATCAVAASERA